MRDFSYMQQTFGTDWKEEDSEECLPDESFAGRRFKDITAKHDVFGCMLKRMFSLQKIFVSSSWNGFIKAKA